MPVQLGNKTECALLGFVLEVGDTYQVYRDETPEEKYKKVFTFNSSRKSMTTVVPLVGGGFRIYTKGASEMVLSKCTFITGAGGKVTPFGERDQQDVVKNVIDPMASNGLRTIGIAYKDISASEGTYFQSLRSGVAFYSRKKLIYLIVSQKKVLGRDKLCGYFFQFDI